MNTENKSHLDYPAINGEWISNGGDTVYKTVYVDEFKGDRDNIRYNVVLLTTTVHGCMVYCVDILAGAYKHI